MQKKYEIVANAWNNGVSEEGILKKYNIKKSTLKVYLSKARKQGIQVISKEKGNKKSKDRSQPKKKI